MVQRKKNCAIATTRDTSAPAAAIVSGRQAP
jgi:hypothetical protein